MWGGATVAPLRKDESKVRPIALTEAPTKLAEAVIVDDVAEPVRAVM